jgi:hypothetical protein
VFALGLVLLSCTAAIVRFNVIGAAPAAEPISGLLHEHPAVENLLFAMVLYGPAAVGCLAFPMAIAGRRAACCSCTGPGPSPAPASWCSPRSTTTRTPEC